MFSDPNENECSSRRRNNLLHPRNEIGVCLARLPSFAVLPQTTTSHNNLFFRHTHAMASRLLFRAATTTSSRTLATRTLSSPHLFIPALPSARRSLATVTLPPPSKEEARGAVDRAPQTTDREEHVGGVLGGEGRHPQGELVFSYFHELALSSYLAAGKLFSVSDATPKQDVFDLSDPHHGDWTMMHRERLFSSSHSRLLTFPRAHLLSSFPRSVAVPRFSCLLRSEETSLFNTSTTFSKSSSSSLFV